MWKGLADELDRQFGKDIDPVKRLLFKELYIGKLKSTDGIKEPAKYAKYRPEYFKKILEKVCPKELDKIDLFDFESSFGITKKRGIKYYILGCGIIILTLILKIFYLFVLAFQLKISLDKKFSEFDEDYKKESKRLTQKYMDKYFRMQLIGNQKDFITPQKAEKTILDLIINSQKQDHSDKVFAENFLSYLKEEIGIKEISIALKSPYRLALHLRDYFSKKGEYRDILDQMDDCENEDDMIDEPEQPAKKLNQNTYFFRKYLQKSVPYLLPKAGDINKQ